MGVQVSALIAPTELAAGATFLWEPFSIHFGLFFESFLVFPSLIGFIVPVTVKVFRAAFCWLRDLRSGV